MRKLAFKVVQKTGRTAIDHVAVQLTRGDALLSLSAHKLMDEWIGFDDWDCNTTIVLASDSCLAVIVTSWVGGDGTSNLLLDFRDDMPVLRNLAELHNEACVDAITTTRNGEILIRDWWKRLAVIDRQTFMVEPFKDDKAFKMALRSFASTPRNEDIAQWVYPWPFRENEWDELPVSSIL